MGGRGWTGSGRKIRIPWTGSGEPSVFLRAARPVLTCLRRISLSVTFLPFTPACCSRCCTSVAASGTRAGRSQQAADVCLHMIQAPAAPNPLKPLTDAVQQAVRVVSAAEAHTPVHLYSHRLARLGRLHRPVNRWGEARGGARGQVLGLHCIWVNRAVQAAQPGHQPRVLALRIVPELGALLGPQLALQPALGTALQQRPADGGRVREGRVADPRTQPLQQRQSG